MWSASPKQNLRQRHGRMFPCFTNSSFKQECVSRKLMVSRIQEDARSELTKNNYSSSPSKSPDCQRRSSRSYAKHCLCLNGHCSRMFLSNGWMGQCVKILSGSHHSTSGKFSRTSKSGWNDQKTMVILGDPTMGISLTSHGLSLSLMFPGPLMMSPLCTPIWPSTLVLAGMWPLEGLAATLASVRISWP